MTSTPASQTATRGAAGSPESALFNAVVHGAAYVGSCIVKNHGGTLAIDSAPGRGTTARVVWPMKEAS